MAAHEDLLLKLNKLWEHMPTLRFGQLMIGLNEKFNTKENKDLFYIEDDLLMEWIDRWIYQNQRRCK